MNNLKILVFSDSHNYYEKMIAITKEIKSKTTLNYIIHLGDLVRDAKYLQEMFPDIPVLYVYGNCDYSYDLKEQEKEIEIGGKKFFVLHGHTRGVKISLDSLKAIALQKKYDIILYGHTHIPKEDYHEGTYIICPGSISKDQGGRGNSYCMIDITGNDMGINIVMLSSWRI